MWWWCGRWCCWGELPRQCGRLDELANLRWVLWARQLRGPASRGGLLSLLGQKKVIKENTTQQRNQTTQTKTEPTRKEDRHKQDTHCATHSPRGARVRIQ